MSWSESSRSESSREASRKIKGTFDASMSLLSGQNPGIDVSLENRKKGDMIKMERTGFLHYAIYIGNDKVIDFVADNGGEVKIRNLYKTVGSSKCAIDNYMDEDHTPYPEKKIVQRALLEIAEDHVYNLGKYNCEHFATWCRYGIKYCHQPCEVAATLGRLTTGGI